MVCTCTGVQLDGYNHGFVLISLLYKCIVVTDVRTFISGGGHFGGFKNPLTLG